MTKPEEIPADVWRTASDEALKYVEWLIPAPNEYAQSQHVLAVSFSRVILAERERCANIAEARNQELIEQGGRNSEAIVALSIAAAIRAGRQ